MQRLTVPGVKQIATMRRPCLMGLGIRLDKTLGKLGIPLPNFPIENVIPKQYTVLLIE
jgi:hypothetical protein